MERMLIIWLQLHALFVAIDIWQSSLGTMSPVTVVCSYLIGNVLKRLFKCIRIEAKTCLRFF